MLLRSNINYEYYSSNYTTRSYIGGRFATDSRNVYNLPRAVNVKKLINGCARISSRPIFPVGYKSPRLESIPHKISARIRGADLFQSSLNVFSTSVRTVIINSARSTRRTRPRSSQSIRTLCRIRALRLALHETPFDQVHLFAWVGTQAIKTIDFASK